MILPPGTEKSALAILLDAPPPARLPPPPYSHLLQGLYRTTSAASGSSSRRSWVGEEGEDGSVRERGGGRGAVAGAVMENDQRGYSDASQGNARFDGDSQTEATGLEFLNAQSDTRRRRERSHRRVSSVGGLAPLGIDTSIRQHPLQISRTTTLSSTSSTATTVPFTRGRGGLLLVDANTNPFADPPVSGSSTASSPIARTIDDGARDASSSSHRKIPGLVGLGWLKNAVMAGNAGRGIQLENEEDTSRFLGMSKGKRWNRRRLGLLLLVVMLFIGGVVGGTLGGIALGKEIHDRFRPNPPPNRVILPWTAESSAITYYPAKSGPPLYDGSIISGTKNDWTALSNDDPIMSTSFTPAGMNQSISTFLLPLNSTELFVHSMGDSASGAVRILGSEEDALLQNGVRQAGNGEVRVDVVMNWKGNSSDGVLVSGMMKSNGGVGVGIYTPKTELRPDLIIAPDPDLSFLILIRFPPPDQSPIVNFLNITTDHLSVRIGNFTNMATFSKLDVSNGRGAITSAYLAGDDVSLSTRTASISGSFNISSSLTMNATAGGISSDVIAWNPSLPPQYRSYIPSVSSGVFLKRQSLTPFLLSDNVPLQPIRVDSQTTCGPLVLSYRYQDPGVILSSTASTTNADASVLLHSSFQGSFIVQSEIGDLQIPSADDFTAANGTSIAEMQQDPWNLGRKRAVCYDSEEKDNWAEAVLNSTGTQLGYTPQRGQAVFDVGSLSWSVQGLTVWLTPAEIIAGASNITTEIVSLAQQLPAGSAKNLTGIAAVRQSTSICTTTWGGAQLGW